jgi:hypothetical protein
MQAFFSQGSPWTDKAMLTHRTFGILNFNDNQIRPRWASS